MVILPFIQLSQSFPLHFQENIKDLAFYFKEVEKNGFRACNYKRIKDLSTVLSISKLIICIAISFFGIFGLSVY